MIIDYRNYALFEYTQSQESKEDLYILGHVVFKQSSKEIGVIIQRHGNNEYRTDMFGNCCSSEIRIATIREIIVYRPKIILEILEEIIDSEYINTKN